MQWLLCIISVTNAEGINTSVVETECRLSHGVAEFRVTRLQTEMYRMMICNVSVIVVYRSVHLPQQGTVQVQ